MHALYQLSGALRVLSKIPLSELQSPSSKHIHGGQPIDTINYPPSVFNSANNASAMERNQNQIEHSKLNPLICEMPEEFDIQLDLAGPHLIRAAEICMDEIEVQANIIRTISVLSEQEKCCDAIIDMSSRLGIMLGPGPKNSKQINENEEKNTEIPEKSLGVLSRIGYILGNIMARSESARLQFYNNDVAMEYLLKYLDIYSTERFSLKKCEPSIDHNEKSTNENDTVIDVVIKLIRVIANMSVSPEVGYGLANCHPLGSVLLSLLLTINKFKFNFVSTN